MHTSTRMRLATLAIAGLLPIIAMPAEEDAPKTREEVERVFESLDRNQDEQISRTEAQRKSDLRKRFAGIDASGDGYLSRSEFSSRPSREPFE